MNKQELLKIAVEELGDTQIEKFIEECAETIHAMQKYKEWFRGDIETEESGDVIEHLVEELEDLKIMLEQMDIRFEYKAMRKRMRILKLNRLAKKLGETYEDE